MRAWLHKMQETWEQKDKRGHQDPKSQKRYNSEMKTEIIGSSNKKVIGYCGNWLPRFWVKVITEGWRVNGNGDNIPLPKKFWTCSLSSNTKVNYFCHALFILVSQVICKRGRFATNWILYEKAKIPIKLMGLWLLRFNVVSITEFTFWG